MSIKETFRRKWEGKAPGANTEQAKFEALLYLADEIEAVKKRLDKLDRAASGMLRGSSIRRK